jgi:hypothetical protein
LNPFVGRLGRSSTAIFTRCDEARRLQFSQKMWRLKPVNFADGTQSSWCRADCASLEGARHTHRRSKTGDMPRNASVRATEFQLRAISWA